jgi:hypothetical protein
VESEIALDSFWRESWEYTSQIGEKEGKCRVGPVVKNQAIPKQRRNGHRRRADEWPGEGADETAAACHKGGG